MLKGAVALVEAPDPVRGVVMGGASTLTLGARVCWACPISPPPPMWTVVALLAFGSPGLGNSMGTGLGLGLSERGTQERAWNWAGSSLPKGYTQRLAGPCPWRP